MTRTLRAAERNVERWQAAYDRARPGRKLACWFRLRDARTKALRAGVK